MNINCNGKLMDLSEPVVMGILNVTPDSFFSGSRYRTTDSIKARAREIVAQGGKIIDIGGYSTRPGAQEVSESEETDRVMMAIEAVREVDPNTPISIDTFRAKVVEESIGEGKGDIVNDISGGQLDPDLFAVTAQKKAPYILMHNIKGDVAAMQQKTSYSNLTNDIFRYFAEKIEQLHLMGVNDIILDPGFGFAKDVEQNYEVLAHSRIYKQLCLPLLIGLSRKRMVWQLLGSNADDSLNGTTVLNTFALEQGADILRVHDVKQAAEAIKIYNEYKKYTL